MPTATELRADASRNRRRILKAASENFVAYGPDAPLEAIAARAGVGTATIYRRFPDRASLVRGVAVDILTRQEAAMRSAVEQAPSAFEALRRFMHAAIDLRVGAILPALGEVLEDDAELDQLRTRMDTFIEATVDRARAEGDLRPDIAFCDLTLLLCRLSRPLPGELLRPDEDVELGHRQLDVYLSGLRAPCGDQLSGAALTADDLDDLVERARTAARNGGGCDDRH